MFSRRILGTFIIVLLFSLSACNLPWSSPATSTATDTPSLNEETLIAQAQQQTLAAAITATPSLTFTPQFTDTPSTPMLTVSVDTNCRTGPGTAYDILGVLPAGQPAEIVGRNTSGDTWVIKFPSYPSMTCWVWGYYATVTGNTSAVPVIAPPPTPTPSTTFTFVYYGWGSGCGDQCMMFTVTNTGGVTWESYTITFENLTDGGSWTRNDDVFTKYDNWCTAIETQTDLMPGENGIAMALAHMLTSHLGDSLRATLTLCTGDGLTGTCITKTLDFIG